jgi:hypothetical protein
MRRPSLSAAPNVDPLAGPSSRSAPSATVCASLTLVATCGVAVLSALALGQPGGLEAHAALALVSAVAGV